MQVHERLAEHLRPGLTLAEIDRFVATTLAELRCKSCFLGYRAGGLPPFPSHACLSVNDCVVHGTAGSLDRPLVEGDLLKIDIGVNHRGWIGDAAWSYSLGEPSEEIRRLMDAGKHGLAAGIRALHVGGTFMDWAEALQQHVETDCGFHLVRNLGGHGHGRKLHTPPFVSNTPASSYAWPDGTREIEPGTLVALEPMVAIGTGQTRETPGGWPIYSADGSMTVHHEHDVLFTEDGPEVLTQALENLTDVIS